MDTYKAKQTIIALVDAEIARHAGEEMPPERVKELMDAKVFAKESSDTLKEDVVYSITRADLEDIAGRKLTDAEYDSAKGEAEWGFGECWTTICETAVNDAMDDPELDHEVPEGPAEPVKTKVIDGKTYEFAWEQMVEPSMVDLARQSAKFWDGRQLIAERITDEPGSRPFSRIWVLREGQQ